MNGTQKFFTYAFLFAITSFTSYFILEFALADSIKAWNFANSGASVFFGFAGTMIISAIIGFATTFYVFKNEDKIAEKLKKKE